MTIGVTLEGSTIDVDAEVFELLFDNSIVRHYKGYEAALSSRVIKFSELVNLSRKADIPYPLFFAPRAVVTAQISLKNQKLLQGVGRRTFSLNTRATVELADVELIVKDLVRKQELVKKVDPALERNPIVGMLKKSSGAPALDAAALLAALDLTTSDLHGCKSKRDALELLITHLESAHILVSRGVNGFMPQTLTKTTAKFSGLTVRDNKVPYIFLAGGAHQEDEEPAGRQVFTLALLAVLVARRKFVPVTLNARRINSSPRPEYSIVAELLMPATLMRQQPLNSLDEVTALADEFKVTPSAVVVRAVQLKMLNRDDADNHLAELARAFAARPKASARTPKPVNAVRKYNGREFSSRMIDALDHGQLTPREFCRVACGNRFKVTDIPDFKRALA